MNKIVTYSFIEALYVIYVLNYFKTKYSLAHPSSNFNSSYHAPQVFRRNLFLSYVNLA